MGELDELLDVFGRQRHGHALLALGDGQLGAVQAVVLLGDAVEVDGQAVGQLAHGDGHAARAEVVAALDHFAGVLAAEQALDLALDGSVALLHLGAAGLDAVQVVGLGRARRAADAVAAGATAQQDHDVARSGGLAAYVVGRGCAHDSADFHALGGVARMVQLVDLARCEADLVAVRGITRGGGGDQLTLGKLALEGLGYRDRGVGRAGHDALPDRRSCGPTRGRGWRRRRRLPRRRRARFPWGGCASRS